MVVARETSLQELLEGSKQYRVPLYQRTYSWSRPQLERLWEDVVTLAEDRAERPKLTHFIGSLVLAPSPSNGPAGVPEFLVVDGQQRLTTLSVLLCAIRDHRARTEDPEHRERVDQQYLINRWKREEHRLKLLPTQADRESYRACVEASPTAGGSDPIGAAYRFFSAKLVEVDDPDDAADIARIEDAVISGLALVSVTAQHGDNAHRIFESLNNTGLQLTQGDLLRNYLFMRLPTRGEAVYHSLWLPLQKSLSRDELEQLFWLDLVHTDPRVKQSNVYAAQQARLDRLQTEKEIENEVARLARLGSLFSGILRPSGEADVAVRRGLERLNAWGTSTVHPLLLHLAERRAQGTATSEQAAAAMRYVESFLVRRLVIGRATANINRILLSIVPEMDPGEPVDVAVHSYLSAGRKYYASDDDIREAVARVPFYLNGRPGQRALVLHWLEESCGSKERVEAQTLTIEHVLPQTLTPSWSAVLAEDLGPDEDVEQVHASLVHTLGNLTLTGYNSELGNADFGAKRARLATSGIAMNQEIAEQDRWGRAQIIQRATRLAERIITTWPGPVRGAAGRANDPRWSLLNSVLAQLPPGAWTTYGDVAALLGSHPIAIGMRLSTCPTPNAHRVLQADGKVSPAFRWLEEGRDDDPVALLEKEGVEFDDRGRAADSQRFGVEELATLIAVDDASVEDDSVSEGELPVEFERFVAQIEERQSAEIVEGVGRVLEAWGDLDGWLGFGNGTETSCFVLCDNAFEERPIWPLTVYPSGRCEVVFQHLAVRRPFDDIELRDELRRRLNTIDGINLPRTKLALRPSFRLSVLQSLAAQDGLVEQLGWFRKVVSEPPS